MKPHLKIRFAAIAIIGIAFLTSCTVQYRARHPRPARHPRVIKVGMEKPAIPIDSVAAGFTRHAPMNNVYIVDGTITK